MLITQKNKATKCYREMCTFSSSNIASKFNCVTDESLMSSKTVWTSEKLELLPSYSSRGDEQGNRLKKKKKFKGTAPEQRALTSAAKTSNRDNGQAVPQAEAPQPYTVYAVTSELLTPLTQCSVRDENTNFSNKKLHQLYT